MAHILFIHVALKPGGLYNQETCLNSPSAILCFLVQVSTPLCFLLSSGFSPLSSSYK